MSKVKVSLIKKIIIAGLPAGLFLVFIHALTASAGITAYITNMAFDIQGWAMSIVCYYLMIGIILTMVYDAIQSGIKGESYLTKGLLFGIFVWMLHTLPSVIYNLMANPFLIDLYKLEFIAGFVSYPLVGVIIAMIFNKFLYNQTN